MCVWANGMKLFAVINWHTEDISMVTIDEAEAKLWAAAEVGTEVVSVFLQPPQKEYHV